MARMEGRLEELLRRPYSGIERSALTEFETTFPLREVEDLHEIENKLSDPQYRASLVRVQDRKPKLARSVN